METKCIPSNIDELFENIEETYYLETEKMALNNIEAMNYFIEEVGLQDNIFENSGTQIIVEHNAYCFKLEINCFGNGDFFNHIFEASIC
jgi:hypothetical protein